MKRREKLAVCNILNVLIYLKIRYFFISGPNKTQYRKNAQIPKDQANTLTVNSV